jgi:hypothetical protein
MDHVGQLFGDENVGEIDQQTRDVGDRDAVEGDDVEWAEPAGVVDLHARDDAPARGHDGDHGRSIAADLQKLRARLPAQRGPFPRREDSRMELGFTREGGVADRVHAAVAAMQDAALDPLLDPVVAEPCLHELRGLRETVLFLGEFSERSVDRGSVG